MKERAKDVGLVLAALGIVAIPLAWGLLKWVHPDMTSRRLMLEYWPMWLVFAVLIIGIGALTHRR